MFRHRGGDTSYAQTSGLVVDSQPRTISNLIVDQTANNPAAVRRGYDPARTASTGPGRRRAEGRRPSVTSPGLDGLFGTADDTPVFFIPKRHAGRRAHRAVQAWFTFFGQFFDHGLDLVTKGGNDIDLHSVAAGRSARTLAPTAAPTNFHGLPPRCASFDAGDHPGPDGILGTPTTSTTTQHHDAFRRPEPDLRLASLAPGVPARLSSWTPTAHPRATGKLIKNRDLGADGHFGTADDDTDRRHGDLGGRQGAGARHPRHQPNRPDFDNVPLLATDPYGNFIPGAHGFPQVVMKGPTASAARGRLPRGRQPAAPIDLTNAVRTGHQFLIDVAHNAVPVLDANGNLAPDADDEAGNAVPFDPLTGRTSHTTTNCSTRTTSPATAAPTKTSASPPCTRSSTPSTTGWSIKPRTLIRAQPTRPVYINQWLMPALRFDVPARRPTSRQVVWNGERLFQAAKFGTEMQYQHLVFEEFARTVQPLVDPVLRTNPGV